MDFTLWSFWWEFNKEPYLNLKAHVHDEGVVTGSEIWFLGEGNKMRAKDTLKPTEAQIRERIVPALCATLEKETNNDIVTGCLIALAKIGDASNESGESRFEGILRKFLADKNQEISETAAVALGILANPKSIPTLERLLLDSDDGRRLVGQPEVRYRTRSFAAYGLGLIGARTGSEEDRRSIIAILRRVLESDRTKTRDIKVSCVIALGMVPLETIESWLQPLEKGSLPAPEDSRLAQIEYMLALLNGEQDHMLRAHCPTALARLIHGLPPEQYQIYRERIASDLIERVDSQKKEHVEVVQSAVLALGLIGTNDGEEPLDRKIRETLATVPKEEQARNFAMIALAKIGGRTAPGAKDPEGGMEYVTKALLAQLSEGKSGAKAWAGLSCGVMARALQDAKISSSRISTLQGAVRMALEDEKDPSRIGAFAIAAGIMGDVESAKALAKRLDSEKEDAARGYVAIGLGLMNARDAIEKIQKIVDESKYRPDLLKQAAIALGLLGDKEVATRLASLLQESRSLATQASISKALGFIGDQRSIEPLVLMLQDDRLTESARSFAAVALGIVGDKEPLPWNTKIGLDLNYRASTQTLTDPGMGTGILDIL